MRRMSTLFLMPVIALLLAPGCGSSSGGSTAGVSDTTGVSDASNSADDGPGNADTAAGDLGDGSASAGDLGAPADTGSADLGTTPDPGPGTTDAGAPDPGAADPGGPDSDPDKQPPQANDVFIKIVGPTGRPYGMSLSSVLPLSGVVFGPVQKITWSRGDKSGDILPGPFWISGPIQLEQGDNTLTVVAEGAGGQTSSDTIHVVYNPAFLFDDYVTVRPSQVFTAKSTKLVVSVPIGFYTNFDGATVRLLSSNAAGQPQDDLGKMYDDGKVSSHCDEIEGDGVYSACVSVEPAEAGHLYFRATVQVTAGPTSYEASSPLTAVDVVKPVTTAECSAVQNGAKAARAKFDELQNASADLEASRAAALQTLQGQPGVVATGSTAGGFGIWARFDSGLLAAVDLTPDGLRGGEGLASAQGAVVNIKRIASRRALIYAPYRSELNEKDESESIQAALEGSGCPPFSIRSVTNGKADLNELRNLFEYGIAVVSSHGDTFFDGIDPAVAEAYGWENEGAQELIWTGENIACDALSASNSSCKKDKSCPNGASCVITSATGANIKGTCVDFRHGDLRNGRIALGAARYGILPSFISRYAERDFPETLVYLGACRSLHNGTFAAELFGVGALAVSGYYDYVSEDFALASGTSFFDTLLERDASTGEGGNLTGDALPSPRKDPSPTADGQFWLYGAANLSIMDAGLINTSWETGTVAGWDHEGDGRVITKLGCYAPVQGKFMGLLSTGLGFTTQTGELSQTFCIPKDKSTLRVRWRFLSEEFREFCGSIFQDTFSAKLESEQEEMTVISTWVDALCHKKDCSSDCGEQYSGLDEACVAFDRGEVWTTPWQEAVVDVTSFAGTGPVTLRLFATDKGDSIYDTVILIDDIRLK